MLESYIDTIIEYINYKAPRVKWGAPESIGNLAQKYPEKVVKAIPNLLKNIKDKSTVIRWCAAFAYSIQPPQQALLMFFQTIPKGTCYFKFKK